MHGAGRAQPQATTHGCPSRNRIRRGKQPSLSHLHQTGLSTQWPISRIQAWTDVPQGRVGLQSPCGSLRVVTPWKSRNRGSRARARLVVRMNMTAGQILVAPQALYSMVCYLRGSISGIK
ncbi:hypothetical protein BD779DRAFT_1520340 [Infundibulicybe gibba]|nr:hypothetical protein BD779DRAFT_1520340 [Infundibulicybe gibba]